MSKTRSDCGPRFSFGSKARPMGRATRQEMRTRWGALRALAAAETSAVAEEAEAEAEAEASDGSEALGDHEEPEVVAEARAELL